MIDEILLLFPCFLCLIWAVLGLRYKPRTYRKRTFGIMMVACAVYFFTAANYASVSNGSVSLVYMGFVGRTAALVIFPIMILYVRRLTFHKYINAGLTLLFLPAVVIPTLHIFIAMQLGVEKYAFFYSQEVADASSALAMNDTRMYELSHIVGGTMYMVAVLGLTLAFVAYILYCLRKRDFRFRYLVGFAKGDNIERRDLLMVILAILGLLVSCRFIVGRYTHMDSKWLSYLLSLFICLMTYLLGYFELLVRCAVVHRSMLVNPVESATMSDVDLDLMNDQSDSDQSVDLTGNNFLMDHFDELVTAFTNTMDKQRLFLKPGLTMDQVAKTLQTNRTYVSRIVNVNFKMSFPDYVNGKRIEYAKMLLRDKPSSNLEDIAIGSGFMSGAQFVRKFRELEGMGVRDWLSSLDS